MTCSREACSQGWANSTLPSMLRSALSLLGSAKPTHTADGCSHGTGPVSPSSGTSETSTPLLPTPTAHDDGKSPDARMAMKRRMPSGERATTTSLAVLARADFQNHGLTSSTAATHASRSARQGSAEAKTTRGICGPPSQQPFAFYDPDSSSVKTSQATLLSDSTGCSPTLPKWGWMSDGELYEHPTPALLTSGHGCSGLLGTPGAADARWGHLSRGQNRSHERRLPTPTSRDGKGRNQRDDDSCLPGAADAMGGRDLHTIIKLMPTPTAPPGSGGNSPSDVTLTDAMVRTSLGERTNPRLDAGNTPEKTTPPDQLTIEDA